MKVETVEEAKEKIEKLTLKITEVEKEVIEEARKVGILEWITYQEMSYREPICMEQKVGYIREIWSFKNNGGDIGSGWPSKKFHFVDSVYGNPDSIQRIGKQTVRQR